MKQPKFNRTTSHDFLEALDRGYEKAGYQEAMRQAAEALEARLNRSYSMGIARLFTYAGKLDRAIDWLEIAYEEHM